MRRRAFVAMIAYVRRMRGRRRIMALWLAMIADHRLGTTIRLVTRMVPGGPVVAIAIRLVDADDRRGRRVPVHEPTGVVVRAVPAAVVVTPVEPVAVEHRVVVVGDDLDARRDLDEIRRRDRDVAAVLHVGRARSDTTTQYNRQDERDEG